MLCRGPLEGRGLPLGTVRCSYGLVRGVSRWDTAHHVPGAFGQEGEDAMSQDVWARGQQKDGEELVASHS